MAEPSTGTPAPDLGASDVAEVLADGAASELPGFLVPYLTEINASAAAEIVRTVFWVYPLLETAHVIGLGLLFGGIFMLDLRLLA